MDNQEMRICQNSILPAGFKPNIPNSKHELTFGPDSLLTPEEQQRFQKIISSIDFINADLSNILENPLNKEDQKRIEEIMNENSGKTCDSNLVNSSLQLQVDPRKVERIKAIDRLLEEMKADGHAYTKNIASNKCKSKYTKTMKSLDELKAEMNKIEESLENSRKNRKMKSLSQDINIDKKEN